MSKTILIQHKWWKLAANLSRRTLDATAVQPYSMISLSLTSSPSASLSLKPSHAPSTTPIYSRFNQLKKLKQVFINILVYTEVVGVSLFSFLDFFFLKLFMFGFDLEEVEEWQVQGGALHRRSGRHGDRRVHPQLAGFSGGSFAGGYGGWIFDWLRRCEIRRYGDH